MIVPAGADTYNWYFNNNLLPETSYALEATAAGSYFVIGSNSDCSASSDTAIIEVAAYPDASLNILEELVDLCEGESFLLEVVSDAEMYQWYQDGEPVGGNSSSIMIMEAGAYYAEVTNANCSTLSETVMVDITPLRIPLLH